MKKRPDFLIVTLSFLLFSHGTMAIAKVDTTYPVVKNEGQKTEGIYTIQKDTAISTLNNASSVMYGKQLLNDTQRLLPKYVGDAMNCNSCHIAEGKKPEGLSYINAYNSYPSYNPRAGKVITLAQRINGCFIRSMNGTALPEDSLEMRAMLDYMKWLSQAVPAGEKVKIKNTWAINTQLTPNPVLGKQLYNAECAACHGVNGEGKLDSADHVIFPPLWGDNSFNIGAGMARTYTAAAFIYKNMPMGINTHGVWGGGDTLSEQDAVDVAEFFTHMPRPDFSGKTNDWPKGHKPVDARY